METIKTKTDLVAWIDLNVHLDTLETDSVEEAADWFVLCVKAKYLREDKSAAETAISVIAASAVMKKDPTIRNTARFLASCSKMAEHAGGTVEEVLTSYEGTDRDLASDLKEHFGL